MSDALSGFAGNDDGTDDNRPPLAKPGQLGDEDSQETLTVEVASEPEMIDTEYGDALRFEAVFASSDPADHAFDGEGPFEAGDDVAVLFWSKRLARELQAALGRIDSSSLAGETINITGSGDGYDRAYTVTVGDE